MGTTTENLGLYKPDITEQYNLAHWNGNTDIVDAELGNIINDFNNDRRQSFREWNAELEYVNGDYIYYTPSELEANFSYNLLQISKSEKNNYGYNPNSSVILQFKCIKNTSAGTRPLILDSSNYKINSEYWKLVSPSHCVESIGTKLIQLSHGTSGTDDDGQPTLNIADGKKLKFVFTDNKNTTNSSNSSSGFENLYSELNENKLPYIDNSHKTNKKFIIPTIMVCNNTVDCKSTLKADDIDCGEIDTTSINVSNQFNITRGNKKYISINETESKIDNLKTMSSLSIDCNILYVDSLLDSNAYVSSQARSGKFENSRLSGITYNGSQVFNLDMNFYSDTGILTINPVTCVKQYNFETQKFV